MEINITIVTILTIVGAILFSMVLHEVMHGLVASHLGDDTARLSGRLTLNPLQHIDPFTTVLLPLLLVQLGLPPFGAAKPVPVDYRKLRHGDAGMALVAVAGPLTNLALAVAFALFLKGLGPSMGQGFVDALAIVVQVNLSFFIFNMIPFPPLDGSRLFYALAPEPVQDVMRMIEGMGLSAIFIFMLVIFPLIRPTMIEVLIWFERILLF
jgi:Zn-dependent protease